MAILMVLFHVQGNLENSILNDLSLNGFYGTSVFFILSGFILSHVYLKRSKQVIFQIGNF